MALEAKNLGFDRLVAVDIPPGEFYGIEVRTGIIMRSTPLKDIINRVKRERNSEAVVSVEAGDNGFNRAVISLKGVHIIRGIQSAEKTAFDHVAARMAADNRVAIDLDLSLFLSGRGITRQRAMHRFRDVLILEQRFEFPITVSSYAHSVMDMRAVREITGLCSLLGMDIPDVEKGFFGVDRITTPPDPAVKVIR
ncbi:MAG: ribonuclease P [Methanoregula sp.]|nr:ribonuclease P [Methanoregula sp.]